jgi:uncharacterized membrane protein
MNVLTYFVRKKHPQITTLWLLSLFLGSIGNLIYCVEVDKNNKDQLIWDSLYNGILILFQIYILVHTAFQVL